MNIPEILQNNITILNLHKRHEARPGLWMLTFPGELMPDGHEVTWQVKGQIKHQNLNEFCDIVRSTWYERQGRQTSAEVEQGDTRDTSSEGGDTNTRVPAGVVVSEAPFVSTVEETLEAVLESQVSGLRDSLRDVEDRITGLGVERTKMMKELMKCESALKAYKGETTVLKIEVPKPTPKKRKTKTKAKPNPASGAKALTEEKSE